MIIYTDDIIRLHAVLLLWFHKISVFLSATLPLFQVLLRYRSLSAAFPWKQPLCQELACCKSSPVMFNVEACPPSTESWSEPVGAVEPDEPTPTSLSGARYGGLWRSHPRPLKGPLKTSLISPVMAALLRAVTPLAGYRGGCLCVIRLCSVCNDFPWSRSLSGPADSRVGVGQEGVRPSPRARL